MYKQRTQHSGTYTNKTQQPKNILKVKTKQKTVFKPQEIKVIQIKFPKYPNQKKPYLNLTTEKT